ncbi:hypothetical protein KTO58_11305 [Chitinophaga pendula]|uniref:hypothetical protein n=1 Tax=Chitinophaga TaxID=79328 RepID=UPI000BAEF0A9|nr:MULTISPECIES: hypothetical protein [Chitinophaga]ASZ12637.1 hypothetical protein CK934_17580 [Chitinophaga sp. MD30]UCJ09753.1 hypothetical protein KTO58_11305 [Chitinophaga pendula]
MIYRTLLSGITGCLFILMTISASVSAQTGQPDVTDVTTSLRNWLKHLDNDFDKYFTREKADDLGRYYADLKKDLTDYMKARKKLSDSLFRNNIAPGKKDPQHLEMLKEKMSGIMGHMRGITDLANNDLRAEGDKLNNQLYEVLYGDGKRYLSNLEGFLDGYDVSKKDLAIDGSAYYDRLGECITLISSIQSKIDRKKK